MMDFITYSDLQILFIAESWCTKCHPSWRNLQLSSTLHFKHRQGWKKWQRDSSVGCTPMTPKMTLTSTSSEWRCSHRRLGMWREFPEQPMLWINISKEVYSKRAYGQQLIGPWCLWTTPLIMGGRKRKASCFPYGPCCPSPGMYSTWMWSALAQVPVLSASAWRQNWNAHVFASVHVRSSWTRNNMQYLTICRFNLLLPVY